MAVKQDCINPAKPKERGYESSISIQTGSHSDSRVDTGAVGLQFRRADVESGPAASAIQQRIARDPAAPRPDVRARHARRGKSHASEGGGTLQLDRKSTRLNSSHQLISYAV